MRALRNPNFRLFWSGNFLSNIGTWMQNVAQGWLVLLLLTNSAFWLGVVGFAGSIPFLFFTLFGGVIADRVNKRRLLIVTQTVMMLLAFLLAALAWFKVITVWEVAAIAFLNGMAMSMNAPSYQALVPRLVKREDLTNAIALNSAQFNMSRILGPTLGGYAMALFGVAGNFFLNGVSFLAVLWALTRIDYPDEKRPAQSRACGPACAGDSPICAANAQMLVLIWMTAAASFLGIPFLTFIPYFAKVQLHAGESGLGWLMACSGLGAVLGAMTVASHGRAAASRHGWLRSAGVVFSWPSSASATRDIFVLSECLAFVGGLQRHPDDLVLQRVDSASVIGRDARPRDEHLCDELSWLAAAGLAAGRGAVAAHSYRPCAGHDGRAGVDVILGFLCLFAPLRELD